MTITDKSKAGEEGQIEIGHDSDREDSDVDAAVLVSPGMASEARSNGSEDEYVSVSPGQLK